MLNIESITKLNILGVEYALREVDCVSKYEPVRGQINHMSSEILLDRNLTDKMKTVTLLHEILHAICDLLGYDELGEDEAKISGLSTALHQVFTAHRLFDRDLSEYTTDELAEELKGREGVNSEVIDAICYDSPEINLRIEGSKLAERIVEGFQKGIQASKEDHHD